MRFGVQSVEGGMSSHVATCHACQAVDIVKPSHLVVTLGFAQNMQRDMSAVVRLPANDDG